MSMFEWLFGLPLFPPIEQGRPWSEQGLMVVGLLLIGFWIMVQKVLIRIGEMRPRSRDEIANNAFVWTLITGVAWFVYPWFF
jgi:hypothetical protein